MATIERARTPTVTCLFAVMAACMLIPQLLQAQDSDPSFTAKETAYSFEVSVGPFPVDIHATIGDSLYNVRAKENYGRGPNDGELWTSLVVYHGGETYDFISGRRSIAESQVGMMKEGERDKLTSSFVHPFTMKMALLSKEEKRGIVKLSIIPQEGVPTCSDVTMPVRLQYRSKSYLMCRAGDRPLVLRFEHNPSYQDMMDYPGYVVSLKTDDGFAEIGGFAANPSSSYSIKDENLPVALDMNRTDKIRSGEYEEYGSKWVVTTSGR